LQEKAESCFHYWWAEKEEEDDQCKEKAGKKSATGFRLVVIEF
jgi:hypothetical protein